jgi:hypothetical protein
VKVITLSIIFLFFSFATGLASEGSFTKDPTCPGGLYLYGAGEGFTVNLYYSDDFGETLQSVVLDTYMVGGIIGDAEPGYLISHYGSIQLSRDYGVSWEYTGATPYNISAGRIAGEIYTFDWIPDRVIKYSLDYGGSWDIHYPSGLNIDDFLHTVGCLEGVFYVLDTDDGELYRSTNFGENFNYISTLQANGGGYCTRIARGASSGELFYYDGPTGDLFFSSDTGLTFGWTHNFPDTNSSYVSNQMAAGTRSGEVFVLKKRAYWEGGGEIFIYYSDNYGYDFTEFHPFSTTEGLPYIHLTALDTTSFPATGGVLEYNIEGRILGPVPYTGDIWCDVTLPNGSTFGPVLGPVENLYMGSYWSANRNRELTVPANAPAGTYTLNAYIGEYDPVSPSIDCEDHLEFEKAAVGEGIGIEKWFVDSGDMFGRESDPRIVPIGIPLLETYPNPFNLTTTLSFTISEAAWVNLTVYSLTGQQIAVLSDGQHGAGSHEVIFDASDLASGIYLARIKVDSYNATQKIVLTK